MRNGMTLDQGVKIIVHDPTKPPNIGAKGIPVRPGTSTDIGFTLEELHLLKGPYKSNCSDEWPSDDYGNSFRIICYI